MKPRLLAVAVAFGLAGIAGCGSPSNPDAPRVSESEPNDTSGQATEVTRNWSDVHLGGACDTASDTDWWSITFANFVNPAPMQVTLRWSGADDLSLSLYDAFGAPITSNAGGTSPASVTSTLTTSGLFLLQVQCNGASAGTPWKVDIPAPGQNPDDG